MNKISIRINGKNYSVPSGATILDIALETQLLKQEFRKIDIPTLFYFKGLINTDESGVCVVEVEGEIVNASTTTVKAGMEIQTDTPKVILARKAALAEILLSHNHDCIHCIRSTSCELQELLHKYGFTNEPGLDKSNKTRINASSLSMVRDYSKCIRCKRCTAVCTKIISPDTSKSLATTDCVNCGRCIDVCPVGALFEKDDTEKIRVALADPDKHVIIEVAPSVRAALGEAFEFPLGVDLEGKLAAALRRLGFEKVYDTAFSTRLAVIEGTKELLDRLRHGDNLPVLTSWCPAWVRYCERFFPDMLSNLSSCKSPQQMFGAVLKRYHSQKLGVPEEKIMTVSLTSCIAQKSESNKSNQNGADVSDVDVAITTREIARMVKAAGIQLEAMPFEQYDYPLDLMSDDESLSDSTGGIIESMLRTACDESGQDDIQNNTTINGIQEISCKVNGMSIKAAVVQGLSNINELMSRQKNGEVDFQLIEVLACPGGCINGGGQPHQSAAVHALIDIGSKRTRALSSHDHENRKANKDRENLAIAEWYKTDLGSIGSTKAKVLLHTTDN